MGKKGQSEAKERSTASRPSSRTRSSLQIFLAVHQPFFSGGGEEESSVLLTADGEASSWS